MYTLKLFFLGLASMLLVKEYVTGSGKRDIFAHFFKIELLALPVE